MPPSERSAGGNGAVTLDELIALNDEIAALVRAGVPLERGLAEAGSDLRGRPGRLAAALGERLGRGESLEGAIEAEGATLPATYRAAVAAGLRSGRLSVALEGLAAYARGLVELRRAVGLALLYPLVVLVVGYGLFAGFVWAVAPRFVSAFGSMGLRPSPMVVWLGRLGGALPYWGPVLPLLLLIGLVWWAWSGRGASLDGGLALGPLGGLPWMRRMLANARAAGFAELVALLIEHGAPLHEAVPLAADAAGGSRLRRGAARLAESQRRGDRAGAAGLPPLLGWLLTAGTPGGDLAQALRQSARGYRRRALIQAEVLRVALPVCLMFALGASATLFYALTLFVPLADLLNRLSESPV